MATRTPTQSPRRSPPSRPPSRQHRTQRRYRRRRIIASVLLVLAILFIWTSVSFVSTMVNPSYGVTYSARAAEWGRDHGLGVLVNWWEAEWYRLHPAKVGGKPPASAFTNSTTPTVPTGSAAVGLPVPARLPSPAGAWLPGEGVWVPAGRTVNGVPAIYTTTVRPDAVHTSYVVGVAWMDTKLLSASLYSGSYIPGGGPYTRTAPITPAASASLEAAFNAGFRMQDANGGYYTDGRMILPLRTGAASMVIYKDGSAAVGSWGSDVSMTPQVVSVRQNLDLIVTNGKPVAGLSASDNSRWGATLGGGALVWRSGIGETKDGALVYVGGPSLAITSLANLLAEAGAVRAMELDINPDWVQYSTYTGAQHAPVAGANGVSLLPTMIGSPSRYFESYWIRDFFTMSARSTPDTSPIAALP